MEPTRIDTVKRDLLRAMADSDCMEAERCIEAIEAEDPQYWRATLQRILAPRPLTCAEVAHWIVEFAALPPDEAAERMPAVLAHCEGCDDCRGALELQQRDDLRLGSTFLYEMPVPAIPPECEVLPLAASGMTGGFATVELSQAGQIPVPEAGVPPGMDLEHHGYGELTQPVNAGGVLVLQRARRAWQWLTEPLQQAAWTLLAADARPGFGEMSPASPPATIVLSVPGLGLEVKVTIELPPALGESSAWNFRFEADPRPGVILWVGLETGDGEESVEYQLLPGGRREFSEAPPQVAYRAHFRWQTATETGSYIADLPELRED